MPGKTAVSPILAMTNRDTSGARRIQGVTAWFGGVAALQNAQSRISSPHDTDTHPFQDAATPKPIRFRFSVPISPSAPIAGAKTGVPLSFFVIFR